MKKLKIVHISTSNKGGAGIAALRLHQSLLKQGMDSSFLFLNGTPGTNQTQYRPFAYIKNPLLIYMLNAIRSILLRLKIIQAISPQYQKHYLKNRPAGFEYFSFPVSDFKLAAHPLVQQADLIHLHWVSDGFLNPERFFRTLKKPLVWTFHDMNPFTGGCHHADDCTAYQEQCKTCPQLSGTIKPQISHQAWLIKQKGFESLQNKQLKIITPSRWLGGLSEKSSLTGRFKHHCIPNSINTAVFKPGERTQSRQLLGLNAQAKIILFVAHHINNPRKGIDHLLRIMEIQKDWLFVSVGFKAPELETLPQLLQLGYISDEEQMAHIYRAADVFVLPSKAENFPNTICEALCCGTPVAAFAVGGIPELVNEQNGALATPDSSESLMKAISTCIDKAIKPDSAHLALLLNEQVVAQQHLQLYNELTA